MLLTIAAYTRKSVQLKHVAANTPRNSSITIRLNKVHKLWLTNKWYEIPDMYNWETSYCNKKIF